MSDYSAIKSLITAGKKVVITAHKSPDGDSIGSTLALFHFLRKQGVEVEVLHPDRAANYLNWLPGFESIHWFEEQVEIGTKLLQEAEVIFCLDYNAPNRVSKEMQVPLEAASGVKIMIDHHLNPDTFCDYIYSFPIVCSTCQLIYSMIDHLDQKELIDEDLATCIYAGLVTDSGSFRFPSVDAETHLIVADLIRRGLNHSQVHEKLFDTNTIDRLKLRGYALSQKLELIEPQMIAMVSLDSKELDQFNYQKGDTEGLVNMALSIEGVRAAALFSEKDGLVKISFRSKGDVHVNTLAADHFEGGGHKYAAGGISNKSMQETLSLFKSLIPNYF